MVTGQATDKPAVFSAGLSVAWGQRAALSLQWGAQPYELLSWPSTVDTMFLANDCPEKFLRLMDKILRLDIRLLDCCQKAGVDFVFLGAPASEKEHCYKALRESEGRKHILAASDYLFYDIPAENVAAMCDSIKTI